MLHFGAKAPLTFEKFIGLCRDLLTAEDVAALENAVNIEGKIPQGTGATTVRRWRLFDAALRNELVKLRAGARGAEPHTYMRDVAGDGSSETTVAALALGVFKNPSIVERERDLDNARWRMLDELAVGHYFDIDALIIYALKLMILLRWDHITAADKSNMLEAMFQ